MSTFDTRLSHAVAQLADDQQALEAFRQGWESANDRGEYGNRVASGLIKIAVYLAARGKNGEAES